MKLKNKSPKNPTSQVLIESSLGNKTLWKILPYPIMDIMAKNMAEINNIINF